MIKATADVEPYIISYIGTPVRDTNNDIFINKN